jgi:PKD repeat protein
VLPSCTLVAEFTYSHDSTGTSINNYHFTNTSVPLAATDSIRWTFGDGTSSNQVSPNHVYTNPGTYTVCLTVIKRNANGTLTNCVSGVCRQITVTLPTACTLVASFTVSHDSTGVNINNYHFTNTSTPLAATDSTRWTFGDGTSSNQVSPNHVYTQSGTYNVCLVIIKRNPNGGLTNCISEVCHTIVVTLPTTCTLVASFTVSHDSTGTAVNYWHFTNTSVPLSTTDSIRWTFGDGTSSNQLSPYHYYANPGTYVVCLRIIKRNPNGVLTNCISEVCHTIVVTLPTTCTLVAAFTASHDSTGTAVNYWHFTNTSTPLASTDSIRWTFGDGTSSNQVSPYHYYAQPGTYVVCLRIIKRNPNGVLTNCISEVCHTIIVTLPTTCTLVASFTVSHDSTGLNINNYHFTNTSAPLSTTDSIRWTFGDGTTSNQVSPNHVYTQSGTYTVCLLIIKRNANGTLTNCASDVCHTVTVVLPTTCNLSVGFTSYRDSAAQISIPIILQTCQLR